MRILVALLVISATTTAFAVGQTARDLFTYQCGESTAVVRVDGDRYSLKILLPSSLTKNFVVQITSEPLPKNMMQLVFNGGLLLSEEEEGWPETGLPKDSVAFVGFRHTNGDPYVRSTHNLNEDGYTFTVESGLLTGQEMVKVADVFAREKNDLQIIQYTCRLVTRHSSFLVF